MTISPPSASSIPSIATMPSRVGEAWRYRRSCCTLAAAAPSSPSRASVTCCTKARNWFGEVVSATSTSGASTSASAAARAGVAARAMTSACVREIAPLANAADTRGKRSSARASDTLAAADPCVRRHRSRNHDAVFTNPSACQSPLRSAARTACNHACSSRSIDRRRRTTSTGTSDAATLSTATSRSSRQSNMCSILRGNALVYKGFCKRYT